MKKNFFGCSTTVAWILTGLVTGASLLSPLLWPFCILGLSWQFALLRKNTSGFLILWRNAGLAGAVQIFIAHTWFWDLAPLTQVGFSSMFSQYLAIFVALVGAMFFVGTGYGLVFAVTQVIVRNRNLWLSIVFPFVVLFGEVLGRLFLSVGIFGPGGQIDISYGIGHVGFVLVNHALLLQLAQFGGVYMLTFVTALIAVVVYFLWEKRRFFAYVFVVVLILSQVYSVTSVIPEDIKDIALISTYVPLAERTGRGIANRVDFGPALDAMYDTGYTTVILPEDARYLFVREGNGQIVDGYPLLNVIDTSRVNFSDGPRLRTYAYNSETKSVSLHDKQYLVPFGEYMPYVAGLFMRGVGLGQAVETVQNEYGYRTGVPVTDVEYDHTLPPVLFCYESVVPYSVQKLARAGDWPYVAHVVSHSWFEDSHGMMKYQLSSMLRVQAVWGGVYILQSANMAPVAVYTPTGSMFVGPNASSKQRIVWAGVDEITEQVH